MKTVYYNGRVFAGSLPLAEAFSVEDGVFCEVGTNDELLRGAEGAEKIDLGGCFVTPGFNDSHMHLLNFGQVLGHAPLAEHTSSLKDLAACLKEHLEAHPVSNGRWLMGRGWNQDYFTDEKRMPNRYDLDAVSKDIPIMITRACGHCCVVNSKALELAGISADTVCPEGGAIGMADSRPDGRLFDNAMDLLNDSLPVPGKAELKEMILFAGKKLNSYGITSCQTDDYCVFRDVPEETVNEAYRELAEAGELTVRVYEQCNFTELEPLARFIEAGNVTGAGDALFKIGPLKMLGDGALGSRTAHLSVPYLDDPGNCGFSLFTPEYVNGMISYANSHGMQIAVHAIGDACLDRVLDAFELALREHPRADHRHGIVHCQVSRADQLERIRRLGLHVYAQSVFLDYDNHIVERLLTPELAKTSYNWKTLLDGCVTVSNGSDCPVELPDVMKGVECAVTRRSLDGTGPYLPEQAFTVEEALISFTVSGARASFEEGVKGRIAPGQYADFTVLDRDPLASDERSIHTIKVLETYLGGRRVYKAE